MVEMFSNQDCKIYPGGGILWWRLDMGVVGGTVGGAYSQVIASCLGLVISETTRAEQAQGSEV